MSEESPLTVFRAYLLKREFTWFDVFLWVVANPVASGLIYYSVSATGEYGYYGGVVPAAFIAAGIVFAPVALLFMIVASSLPRSASPYVLASRGLGALPGFIAASLYLFMSGGLLSLGFLAYSSIEVLGDGLTVSGHIAGSSILVGLGSAVRAQPYMLLAAFTLVTVLFLAAGMGRKSVKALLHASTAFPLVLYAAVMLSLFPFSRSVFTGNWDRLFNNSYSRIVDLALNGGVVNGVSVQPLRAVSEWSGTFTVFTMAVWAYLGVENASFIAGEVREPGSSYLKGYIAGYMVLVAMYTVTPVAVTLLAGYDFLSAYSYLYHHYPDVLKTLMGVNAPPAPCLATIVSVYTGNMVTSLLFTLAAFLFYFNTMLTSWVSATRILFALGEDRLMPRLTARVSRRTHVPGYANLFIYILSIAVVSASPFIRSHPSIEASFIRLMTLGYAFFLTITGLALISTLVFAEELYERFTFKDKRVLYPIGFTTSVVGFALALSSFAGISLTDILVASTGFSLILLLFIAVTLYMKRRGVRYSEVFSRIPPM